MIKPLSLIAVILCGLGIALYFYEQGAEQGQENLSGQILLKQLDTKNLNKIQVRSSEGLLELHQSQQGWQETGLDYPLSGEKIQEFLLELTDLRLGDLVTDNPERHALFQLLSPPESKEQWEDEKHAVAVNLLRGDDSSLLEILLGKSREQGSGQYLRYADSDEAYLLPDTLDIDTDPNDWLNKELTSLDEKMIQKLDFQNSSDSDFTLTYDNQSNSWSMSDSPEAELKEDEINDILKRLQESGRRKAGFPDNHFYLVDFLKLSWIFTLDDLHQNVYHPLAGFLCLGSEDTQRRAMNLCNFKIIVSDQCHIFAWLEIQLIKPFKNAVDRLGLK